MLIKNDLTYEYVSECLTYCPETGLLTWLFRPVEHFKSESRHRYFTKRYAGKVAGWKASDGYINVRINGQAYRAHRIAWLLHHQQWPINLIDHINGNIADNTLSNLRDVNKFQNAQNIPTPSNNTSGHIGVCRASKGDFYRAQIYCNGKNIHLGLFRTIEEAVKARERAQIEYGFHENHGR